MLKQFKTDRSNYSLILISVFCLHAQIHTADRFKELAEKKYQSSIISSLCTWTDQFEIAEAAFQEVQQHDRVRHMGTLLAMFGDEVEEKIVTQWGRHAELTSGMLDKASGRLLRIANKFNLFKDAQVREAFFATYYRRFTVSSIFKRAIRGHELPTENIKLWFACDEAERNKQRMLLFLNTCDTFLLVNVYNRPVQERIVQVCDYIDFDLWDAVAPHARWVLNKTVSEVDAQKIKSFMTAHGVEFNDNLSGIQGHRNDVFIALIKQYYEKSDIANLQAVAQFLSENIHIFEVRKAMEDCFGFMRSICDKQKVVFEPGSAILSAYMVSLCFQNQHRGELDRFSYVTSLLRVCSLFQDHQFIEACELLVKDERYPAFLERSRVVLEAYLKMYPTDEHVISEEEMRRIPVKDNLDKLIELKRERRMVEHRYIQRILSEQTSLFGLLLERCASKLWPEQSNAGSGPSCSYEN